MQVKYLTENEIGLDEAGRGPLFGRVYAGAVIWNNNITNINIIDSKKISKKKREENIDWIKSNVIAWGVGYSEPNEIDEINILNATTLAMNRAIENLKQNFILDLSNYSLIIDGIGWNKKFINYNVNSIIKGDNKYYSIAAASILAKVYHDKYIEDICKLNPDLDNKYNLLKNMGYPTKKHFEGIKQYGITEYHRKTFKGCF